MNVLEQKQNCFGEGAGLRGLLSAFSWFPSNFLLLFLYYDGKWNHDSHFTQDNWGHMRMTLTRMTVLSNSNLSNNNYSYSFYLYSIQVD